MSLAHRASSAPTFRCDCPCLSPCPFMCIFPSLTLPCLPSPVFSCACCSIGRCRVVGSSDEKAAPTGERRYLPALLSSASMQEAHEAVDSMLRPAVRGLAMLRALGALHEGDEGTLERLAAANTYMARSAIRSPLPAMLRLMFRVGPPRTRLSTWPGRHWLHASQMGSVGGVTTLGSKCTAGQAGRQAGRRAGGQPGLSGLRPWVGFPWTAEWPGPQRGTPQSQ